MAGEKGDSERGFVVIDRRGRDDEEARKPAAAEAPEPASPRSRAGQLPAVDFSSFALSLGTSALYHMGLIPEPGGGPAGPIDLPLASQTIDTLAMLQQKTRGNLDEEEAKLVEGLLYELRMRYVEASRRGAGLPPEPGGGASPKSSP